MSPCDAPDLEALDKSTTPFPFSSIPRRLKLKPAELVPALRKAVDDLILRSLKSKDAAEFRRIREHDIGEYASFVRALSTFVLTNVDDATHTKIINETLTANEHRLKLSGLDVIGIDATNEALFYFVTMRKTYELVRDIRSKLQLTESQSVAEDRSLSKRSSEASLWVTYHYEFLLAAVAKKNQLPSDVLREALEGLKFADIAYTCAKQAYLLRYPEKALHKYYAAEHPCDHAEHGSTEEIAADSLKTFDEWAPYRERANKPPLPQ
jgi:hypothetical protein